MKEFKELENVNWTYVCPNCSANEVDEACPICHGARKITIEQLKERMGEKAGVAFVTALAVDHGVDEDGNMYIPGWSVVKAGVRALVGEDIFHVHMSCRHPHRNEILQVCDITCMSKSLYQPVQTIQKLFGEDWVNDAVGCEAIAVVNKNGILKKIFVPQTGKSINSFNHKYLKMQLLKGESFF